MPFDTPFGFTDATQLGFVPLLFAVPLALVPLVVALALAITWLPEVVRGELRPARLLHVPWNSLFALGPVVVFAAAGVDPRHAGPVLLVAALGGQFAADFIASGLHHLSLRQATLSSLLHARWVYLIDAAVLHRAGRCQGCPHRAAGRPLARAAARPARHVRP